MQRNELAVISVYRQRVGVPSKRAPIWTISVSTLRPVWRSSWPLTGFYRDCAIESRVVCEVNLAHSAHAKLRAYFVTTEFCSFFYSGAHAGLR